MGTHHELYQARSGQSEEQEKAKSNSEIGGHRSQETREHQNHQCRDNQAHIRFLCPREKTKSRGCNPTRFITSSIAQNARLHSPKSAMQVLSSSPPPPPSLSSVSHPPLPIRSTSSEVRETALCSDPQRVKQSQRKPSLRDSPQEDVQSKQEGNDRRLAQPSPATATATAILYKGQGLPCPTKQHPARIPSQSMQYPE